MGATTWTVIGGGNGGQASAADMALQGRRVRLYEFPEFASNLDPLRASKRIEIRGAVQGTATLDAVTSDLEEALEGAEAIMVATQALAHERAARALAPLVGADRPIVLNPGSTGGALKFARIFRDMGVTAPPVLVELGTLTYGCRAADGVVDCPVKVGRVLYGTLPADAIDEVGPDLESMFPGLVRAASVLEAGLANANPVIHPPITLLNGARFEKEGERMFFYADGVSPSVAALIEKLDGERMALLEALGYAALSDPETSVQQGYASSADYYECYAKGPGFSKFRAPGTLDHRYVHEDMGLGLVLYTRLGRVLGVDTPTAEAFVRIGSALSGIDYFEKNGGILADLGIDGLYREALRDYLHTGRHPG